MIRPSSVLLVAVTALVAMACADSVPPSSPTDAVALIDVDVIPMDSEGVIRHQTVVINDGLIASMGDASDVEVPAGATRIDASGQFLIPGLCDMHVHLEGDAWNVMFPPDERFQPDDLDFDRLLFPYLANGVTTVQVMSALPEHVGVRESISNGEILGPRLILSRMIDGPDRAWPPPISTWVGSPEEARQAVIDAHDTGYDSIKVYSFLDREAYEAIVTTARELGLKVIGHIPYELSLDEILAAGQDLIAHSEEVLKQAQGDFSPANIDSMARSIAASGTWVTPTLTTSRNILAVFENFDGELDRPEVRALHPMTLGVWTAIYDRLYRPIPEEQRAAIRQGFEDFQRPFTLALHDAGGKLMTGTDALIPSTVPGFSLHDELAELVGAGLSPFEALRCSTTQPHAFLDELERGGTIEVGKRADLVLLRANPLVDISNTRRISGVVVGGRWISEESIRTGLESYGEGPS